MREISRESYRPEVLTDISGTRTLARELAREISR